MTVGEAEAFRFRKLVIPEDQVRGYVRKGDDVATDAVALEKGADEHGSAPSVPEIRDTQRLEVITR